MKQALRKLLVLFLAATMVFSVMAPALATGTGTDNSVEATVAPVAVETALPDQDWQMNRAFPNGTDDTLAINSLGSWTGYRDQGEIYVTLNEKVESLRLFVNNVEIDTSAMEGGKTYKVDISSISVDGTNTVQVSNVYPVGSNKIVTVRVGYPEVITGTPEDVGMDSTTLDTISDLINLSCKYGFSGAQLAIVKDGKMVWNQGYGAVNGWNSDGTQIKEGDDNYVAVTTNTLYDLASNSKMYTVNYAIQYLYEQGKLNLETKIVDLFPEFATGTIFKDGTSDAAKAQNIAWKETLTIKDILMHQAGFPADPMYHNNNFRGTGTTYELYSQDRDTTKTMVLATPLNYEPGTKTVYSDADYMLLCFVVEEITGKRIDAFLKEIFWDPMGLTNVCYNPLENGFTANDCAATELDGNKRADFGDLAEGLGNGVANFNNMRQGVIQGTVHDEKAYYSMGGISGHAGLFSSAENLAKLCTLMLTGGYGGNSYWSSSTMEMFTEAKSLSYTTWGLGWWREAELGRSSYWTTQSSNNTIGHQGWTGTMTMIDPDEDLVIVLLTNKKNSPILANEKGSNDFFSDNMVLGCLGVVMEFVYESIRSSDDAVDASVYQLAQERIRLLYSHKGAYDENAHMNDCFALVDLAITRAEKRQTAETVAYAKELVATLESEVALYVTGTYGINGGTGVSNVGNANNVTNAQTWLAEFKTRLDALQVVNTTADAVMTAVPVDDAPGIDASTLGYSASESADQNAVYFPRVMSSTGRSTSNCYRNYTTWYDTFEGQGTVYVSVYKAVSSMRMFINGHEVDCSNMLNTTGIFAIDCSEYTLNGRNLIQITDLGYNTARSILVVVNNPEVVDGTAEEVGINEAVFDMIDTIVENDVEYGFPSAQLALVKDGKLIHTNAWGLLNSYNSDGTHVDSGIAVTDETLYDLASNTKMYSVNYALQYLVTKGKVSLSDKITKYFPTFAESTIWVDYTAKYSYSPTSLEQVKEWKSELTIQDILEHQAGFPADPVYYDSSFNQATLTYGEAGDNVLYAQGREDSFKMVLATPLYYQPGTRTVYSDVDYMLLGMIVEQVTGTDLNTFLKQTFWDPMGLTHITYNPLENGFAAEDCAATEINGDTRDGNISFPNNRTTLLQGLVHDGKCYHNMDGISGHAGLFANATTLAKLAQVMQNYNGYGTVRLADFEVNEYFTGRKDSLANWGMGWWRQGNYQRPWYFGQQAPSTTIGHQGWTGTLTSIDTENNLTTVYLTNKINSAVTDPAASLTKFDGNWYTASSLGFVPTIVYLGMDSHNAAEDIQPALDALLIDMAVIKMNRVVGNGTTDTSHPNLVSAYSIMEAACEAVAARPTKENRESLAIAFESMRRKFTEAELQGLYEIVHDPADKDLYTVTHVDATCEHEGYDLNTCIYCGYSFRSNVVDCLGHDIISTVVDPTCDHQGYTVNECTRCDYSYISDMVDAKGHTYEAVVTAPTCTTAGYTTYTCSVCGSSYVADVVEPLGHSYESVVTEPTCTAAGYTTHTCATCGHSYVDSIVEAKGHTYKDVVTAPTHDKMGYTTHTCDCGYSYVDSYVDALGHEYTRTVTTEPTCTTEGVATYTCECGKTYTESIPMVDHEYVAVVTEPTCTEMGYTTYTCACGDTYVADYVNPTGHDCKTTVVEATCTTYGYTINTCDCGYSYVSDIQNPTGHSYELVNVKEVTCNADGYTGDEVCSVCGDVKSVGEVIPAGSNDCPAKAFTDLNCSRWYHESVVFALENGLMKGMDATTFAPDGTATRGQVVTILYRYSGETFEATESTFTDVDTERYYYTAIEWAAANGIVLGIGNNQFAPDAAVTRQQLVVILYNFAKYLGEDVSATTELNGFGDAANVSGWAEAAMKWAVAEGLLKGDDNSNLNPTTTATRVEIAALIERLDTYLAG